MHKKQEKVIIRKYPEQTKIIHNKVSNRFLKLSKSVELGLEPEPCLSDFQIKKELGKGSFGQVFLAMHKTTKVNYAIKAIDKRNKNNVDGKPYFRREIEIMYKIKHPNCVRLFGHFEEEIFCFFIMEYIPKGNLYNLIKANKNFGLEKTLVAKIMRSLINAIHYLHNMNPPIIHRDIKPENILLTDDNDIKLTDFGWANYINVQEEERNTLCGTPLYLAPEMIESKGHGKYVDIWCLGVLLFELLVGQPPFSGKNKSLIYKNILNCHILWPKYPKKEIDKDAKDLISRILKINPKERISLEDIIKHPFFTKNCPEQPQYFENITEYYTRPYIINKDKPFDKDELILAKKIKYEKKNESSFDHISPRIYLSDKKKYKNNNLNDNEYLNQNKNENVENNNRDKETRKLIYNKSAINFFPKIIKPIKKKLYKTREDIKEKEKLLKLLIEYEQRDKEKNKKIEELSLENTNLKYILKKKEEELKQKEYNIILLKETLNKKNNISNNKNILTKNYININNNKYLENENNFFSVESKKDYYTSRTPDVSPAKIIKRRKIIPNTPNKCFTKKNLMIYNKDNSFNSKVDKSFKSFETADNATNMITLDNNEIKELRREINEEKEKHKNAINDFINEIRILQIENKFIKEKEKIEIIKLTRHLIENEKEIKKWKTKVKELELKINEKYK